MSNNDNLIPVPRAELLAWAKAWKNAYGPLDGAGCVTPFDPYLGKAPADPVAADNAKAADRACLAMIALGFYWNSETWVLPEKAEAQPAGGALPRVFVTWESVMRGAADVLHESSKQHWANGDKGHSLMCDEQVDELVAAIAALADQQGGE